MAPRASRNARPMSLSWMFPPLRRLRVLVRQLSKRQRRRSRVSTNGSKQRSKKRRRRCPPSPVPGTTVVVMVKHLFYPLKHTSIRHGRVAPLCPLIPILSTSTLIPRPHQSPRPYHRRKTAQYILALSPSLRWCNFIWSRRELPIQ